MQQWRAFGFSASASNELAERFIGIRPWMDACQSAVAYVRDRATALDLHEFVVDNPNGTPDANSIADLIAAFGITEQKREEYANRILEATHPFRHPLEDWLAVFFRDAVSQPVSPPSGFTYGQFYTLHNRSLNNRSTIGFHVPYGKDSLKPDNMKDEVLRLLNADEVKARVAEGQHFLFHGTNHERANTCAKRGIKPFGHSAPCDFGENCFYVGRHLLSIVEHAANEHKEAPALLVYACTNEELLEEPFADAHAAGGTRPTHVLDFYEKGEPAWQQCVKYWRNGCQDEYLHERELQRLLAANDSLDFIRGPWQEGPRDGKYQGFRPDPSKQPDYPRDDCLAVAKYINGPTDNNEQIAINTGLSKPTQRMDSFLILAVFWQPADLARH